MVRRTELGVRVAGFVGGPCPIAGIPSYDYADLAALVKREGVRRIIVTMGDRRGRLKVEELLKLKAGGIQIQDGPEYYESATGRIPLESLRLSWLLFSPGFHVPAGLQIYKRLFSLLLGSIAVILTSPLMLIAAIAVRLDSKGPVIFRQKRVGEHGEIFHGV